MLWLVCLKGLEAIDMMYKSQARSSIVISSLQESRARVYQITLELVRNNCLLWCSIQVFVCVSASWLHCNWNNQIKAKFWMDGHLVLMSKFMPTMQTLVSTTLSQGPRFRMSGSVLNSETEQLRALSWVCFNSAWQSCYMHKEDDQL